MHFKNTHVIALVNQKGGSGKTTCALSLTGALAVRGLSVCIVDADGQCNATQGLGLNQDELDNAGALTVADIFMRSKPATAAAVKMQGRLGDCVSVIRGNRGLDTIDKRLDAELLAETASDDRRSLMDQDELRHQHRRRLRQSLRTLPDTDVIIIDTPPSLGFIMTAALIAADWYIVPVVPSKYDLAGFEALVATAAKVKQQYNRRLEMLGVVISKFSPRAKLDQDVFTNLKDTLPNAVFKTVINDSVKHREATFYGKTIMEHAPSHTATLNYMALSAEVLRRIEPTEQQLSDEPDLAEAQNG